MKMPFECPGIQDVTDPYAGRLAYVRVCSGKLEQGLMAYNSSSTKRENWLINLGYADHAKM
jgi:translation elongation factor EF-G